MKRIIKSVAEVLALVIVALIVSESRNLKGE